MKSIATILTLWLVCLFSTTLPVRVDECCSPKSPCCPAGQCRCHVSEAPPTPVAPHASTTVPTVTDTLSAIPASATFIFPLPVIPHINVNTLAASISPPPAYLLTHAFLI